MFDSIDTDKNNTVDIDELIEFITSNQDNLTSVASSAVMDIKTARNLSIMDMRDIFQSMPQNFIASFIRSLNSKGENLPSLNFRPRYNPDT